MTIRLAALFVRWATYLHGKRQHAAAVALYERAEAVCPQSVLGTPIHRGRYGLSLSHMGMTNRAREHITTASNDLSVSRLAGADWSSEKNDVLARLLEHIDGGGGIV